MGIPPNLRGRVWKCLLSIDSLSKSSDFNYQVGFCRPRLRNDALMSGKEMVLICLAQKKNPKCYNMDKKESKAGTFSFISLIIV